VYELAADALDWIAHAVKLAKIAVIAQLGALAVEITTAAAASLFTLGLTDALDLAATAAARITLRQVFDMLQRQVMKFAEMVAVGAGWAKQPELFAAVCEAFSLAIQRSTGADISPAPDLLIARLQAFDAEDDGSDEWQHMVDLIEMVTVAIDGHDIGTCLETSLRLYLEG
jgi:hypothetical protein